VNDGNNEAEQLNGFVLQVLSVHQGYSLAMRERAKKGFPIGSIGDILSNMFLGKKLIRSPLSTHLFALPPPPPPAPLPLSAGVTALRYKV
jgi:hypothetical protein